MPLDVEMSIDSCSPAPERMGSIRLTTGARSPLEGSDRKPRQSPRSQLRAPDASASRPWKGRWEHSQKTDRKQASARATIPASPLWLRRMVFPALGSRLDRLPQVDVDAGGVHEHC